MEPVTTRLPKRETRPTESPSHGCFRTRTGAQGRKVVAPDDTYPMSPYRAPKWEDTPQGPFSILSSLGEEAYMGLQGADGGQSIGGAFLPWTLYRPLVETSLSSRVSLLLAPEVIFTSLSIKQGSKPHSKSVITWSFPSCCLDGRERGCSRKRPRSASWAAWLPVRRAVIPSRPPASSAARSPGTVWALATVLSQFTCVLTWSSQQLCRVSIYLYYYCIFPSCPFESF